MTETSEAERSDSRSSKTVSYAWILAGALGLIYLINMGFPMYGGSVANTYMTEALGLSRSTLGAGFSLFTLCQGVSGVVILFSIYRMGIRSTILLGGITIFLGALLMRFTVTTSWQYVLIYGGVIGLGVGFGTVLPITTSITLWFDRRRALAMSLVLTAGGIGGLIAAPLIDRVVTSGDRGWQVGWEVIAVTVALSCLITVFMVREKPSLSQTEGTTIPDAFIDGSLAGTEIRNDAAVYRTTRHWSTKDALRSPTLWRFALGSLGFVAPYMLCVAHSAIHLRDLGVGASRASLALGLITAFSIAGRLVAGSLGDRFEPRLIWAVSLLLLAVGCVAIIGARSIVSIVIFTLLVGMGFGGAYVCRPITIANYFGTAAFASINGILGSLVTVLAATAPYLAGLAYDAVGSYVLPFLAIAVLAALSGLGLLSVREPRPDGRQEHKPAQQASGESA